MKSKIRYTLIIMSILTFPFSCGDIFASQKKIVGNYYLVHSEGSNDFRIMFKAESDMYIGRIPERIIEFGWKDSILVGKFENQGEVSYYVINMKRDSMFAEPKDYLIDSLKNELEFKTKWEEKLNIKLKKL